jgi:hypothetical protein
MTFSFNTGDPWVTQKLGYIEGALNPAVFCVPKQIDLSAQLLAFLRLKHYETSDISTLQNDVYSSWS